jgi:hypothetical protein
MPAQPFRRDLDFKSASQSASCRFYKQVLQQVP